MTKIIAEIGWNHMGDLKLAKKMFLKAKKNGADLVKIQIFNVERLTKGSWDKDGRRQIYEKAQINNIKKLKALSSYCGKIKIPFFASVFSKEDADLLAKVQKKLVKIASSESRNYDLIKYCSKIFKHLIISTGTSKFSEIKKISKILPKKKYTLLHCISSYPCEEKFTNFPKISYLKKISKDVGFSDHTIGIDISILSLEHDPAYIEKHFTTDRSLPGRDNKFAILPDQLFKLSEMIKKKQLVNKFKGLDFQKCEKQTRKEYFKRWDRHNL